MLRGHWFWQRDVKDSRCVGWRQDLVEALHGAPNHLTEASGEELCECVKNSINIHIESFTSRMAPLPVKNGLNPSCVPLPHTADPTPALEFITALIDSQRHRHPDDDADAIRARFAAGEVVDDAGRPFAPDDVIRPGRFVNFYRTPAPERPVPGVLSPLFQDANLLVLDKPSFLATLPRGQHITETALVKARRQFDIPELSPAHRLDRLTRGALMFTIRPEVRGAYQRLFDERVPDKSYEAVTVLPEDAPFCPLPRFEGWRSWAAPSPEQPWVLEHHMIKIRGRLSTYLDESWWDTPADSVAPSQIAHPGTPAAPNAITHVTGIREDVRQLATATDPVVRPRKVLVWELVPLTGKTHQLRLALRSLGLPILNDPLYEELSDAALTDPAAPLPTPVFVEDEDFTRPMELTAKSLAFDDPFTGHRRVFQSEF